MLKEIIYYLLNPEIAHYCALKSLPLFYPSEIFTHESLKVNLWNKDFFSPLGMAAGMDKNGEYIHSLLKIGFSFLEIGTITPMSQPGNTKPRVFRLKEDLGIVNRLGFNNKGASNLICNIAKYRKSKKQGLIGISIGKQYNSTDPVQDYVALLKSVHNFADYVVLNISSPNTAGLRDLQAHDALKDILTNLFSVRKKFDTFTPILLKISPDVSQSDLEDIAELSLKFSIEGVVLTNTTITRSDLKSSHKGQYGGLSGRPLFNLSNRILNDFYVLTKGKIPLIGCGGIMNGKDAYIKIRNGASLIQIYAAIVYHGFSIVQKINMQLVDILKQEGFKSVSEVVGLDCNV